MPASELFKPRTRAKITAIPKEKTVEEGQCTTEVEFSCSVVSWADGVEATQLLYSWFIGETEIYQEDKVGKNVSSTVTMQQLQDTGYDLRNIQVLRIITSFSLTSRGQKCINYILYI